MFLLLVYLMLFGLCGWGGGWGGGGGVSEYLGSSPRIIWYRIRFHICFVLWFAFGTTFGGIFKINSIISEASSGGVWAGRTLSTMEHGSIIPD